ncbi:uncharacterized protein LOC112611957 [Theropithecus gelada]|uniref:uncharacterized protein LOC112611957 n=1 Tax=Theropithecus gelada TaxID=9565 RepID=UPI000DC19479|nr:uncharacterized protein LOC112611957 [Theropithecus gelada]
MFLKVEPGTAAPSSRACAVRPRLAGPQPPAPSNRAAVLSPSSSWDTMPRVDKYGVDKREEAAAGWREAVRAAPQSRRRGLAWRNDATELNAIRLAFTEQAADRSRFRPDHGRLWPVQSHFRAALEGAEAYLCGPRGRCSGPSPALPRAAGVVGAGGQICAWPEDVRWRHSPSSARPCVHYALPERGPHGGTGNAPRAAFDVFLGFWSFPPSLNNWICKHDGLCFPELVLCLFFWPHLAEQHIKATEHQESCCLGKFCGKCPGGLGAGRALLSLSCRLGRASRRLPGRRTMGRACLIRMLFPEQSKNLSPWWASPGLTKTWAF